MRKLLLAAILALSAMAVGAYSGHAAGDMTGTGGGTGNGDGMGNMMGDDPDPLPEPGNGSESSIAKKSGGSKMNAPPNAMKQK